MVNGLSRHPPPPFSECHSELKLWTQSLISSLLQSHIQSSQKCHILPNPNIKNLLLPFSGAGVLPAPASFPISRRSNSHLNYNGGIKGSLKHTATRARGNGRRQERGEISMVCKHRAAAGMEASISRPRLTRKPRHIQKKPLTSRVSHTANAGRAQTPESDEFVGVKPFTSEAGVKGRLPLFFFFPPRNSFPSRGTIFRSSDQP